MKNYLILTAAAIALAACNSNNEDGFPDEPVAAKISATIGESAVSRASNTSWAQGDEIGISSVVGEVKGPFINLKYTTAAGDEKFSGSTPIFFYKPMTLNAYYPFTGTQGTAPGKDGIIEADTKIDKQSPVNQPKIDFLWDQRKDKVDFSVSNPEVKFIFSHKMSKLTFTFVSSQETKNKDNVVIAKGVNVEDMTSYSIEGLGLVGNFDTATGICAINEEAEPRSTLTVSFPTGTVKSEEARPSLIIFPQKQPDSKFWIHIITSEKDDKGVVLPDQKYKCALPLGDKEIKPGCHYKFTVQVTKLGLIVGDMTIEKWELAREWSGTAPVDGEILIK